MYDTVIIIPYRAREKHLEYFIENTVPLLQKHIPNSKVVIIEQDWNNKLFNRGCLLNIGDSVRSSKGEEETQPHASLSAVRHNQPLYA